MKMNEYQALARRTQNPDLNMVQRKEHALMGLVSELGEVCAHYQKVHQGHPMDADAVIKELGDMMWFMAELCDVTVAVTAPGEQRISRLMARDGITEAYAISRIQAQPTEEYFRNNCGYVLENDGDGAQFRHKCLAFFRQLGIMKENPQEV